MQLSIPCPINKTQAIYIMQLDCALLHILPTIKKKKPVPGILLTKERAFSARFRIR
jgi:hypothetical protein